jgi:hypothetical protein
MNEATMTEDEAVERLRTIQATMTGDPECAHSDADGVLLELAGPNVAEAYRALVGACRWWAHA